MAPAGKPLYKSLYFQVIVAIAIGVLIGHFLPQTGEALKPLGDGFIKLIKMIIAPIIICTAVVGIAGIEDMKKVGQTGGYALLYFEVVSSMSEARALTKPIGNGVATVVVGKWCGELDEARMRRVLNSETKEDAEEPKQVLDALQGHPATKGT